MNIFHLDSIFSFLSYFAASETTSMGKRIPDHLVFFYKSDVKVHRGIISDLKLHKPEPLPEPGIFALKICVQGNVSLELFPHSLLVGEHVLVEQNQYHPLTLVLEGLDVGRWWYVDGSESGGDDLKGTWVWAWWRCPMDDNGDQDSVDYNVIDNGDDLKDTWVCAALSSRFVHMEST